MTFLGVVAAVSGRLAEYMTVWPWGLGKVCGGGGVGLCAVQSTVS